ncbi:PREDICTED: NAC transcription factor 29-like isoform X3 [Erythranthe guttata]|uniref:NAC transcription factor 29-like isoform X2 n=1 Tax=Erythranthe guttata TaxID=4155 RepID=UPI00064D969D|nr:PREDICTED: NAC transcription factor 29-like isoform X2 [Erythranthe guttata]XP_012854546.1 PREDICTED: NAC transcription factor 29-like isoform X3 [Erythranthe guttata]|eukprot:XP_012854545.1 PREDICTED: NAC transcription factor 29-like isoform X2 [Erythranthe guttata]
MRIAPGYRFLPSDEELINCYLLKESMGIQLPWNPMSKKDIYGQKDPWEVFQDVHWDDFHSENKFKHVTYVLTKLLRLNGKTRIARRTKSGTWKGQTSGKEIYDESSGNLIGLSKMFTFYKNKPKGRSGEEEEEEHGHWIMHEFSLAGVSLNFELKFKDYAICRITRTFSKENKKEKTKKQPEIIVPQELNPTLDEEDQLLADELQQAMYSDEQIIVPQEQNPITDEDDQLLEDEIERAVYSDEDRLLGMPNIGKKRLAEDEGIEEDRDAFSKMQKIDLDNIEYDFDIDIDDITLKDFGLS